MSPELELLVVVGHPVWALGSKLSLLVRSAYVLHCWAVSGPRDCSVSYYLVVFSHPGVPGVHFF